jgi:hypothetical protein
MIQEFDIVVLTRDLPAEGLRNGDLGAVVLVHQDGAAFEVEFVTLDGETLAIVTLPADAVRHDRTRVSRLRDQRCGMAD